MGNDFFDNHPILGSVLDLNHDGSLNAGEVAAASAFGALYADEMMRASEEAERDARRTSRDDESLNDEDASDSYDNGDRDEERSYYDFLDDDDVDTTSRRAVMRAAMSDSYLDDIECLVENALNNGVRFKPQDVIDLSYEIYDEDLLVRLISTSKPRFLQEDADELSPHWGTVELEYHEEAFDEEYSEGSTYHVNTPEEDW